MSDDAVDDFRSQSIPRIAGKDMLGRFFSKSAPGRSQLRRSGEFCAWVPGAEHRQVTVESPHHAVLDGCLSSEQLLGHDA